MKQLKIIGYFFRLIRWPNLIILIVTMFLMRYGIIESLLYAKSLELGLNNHLVLQLSFSDFILLIMATGLITSAGYIINDYFDRKTDMINKPYKVIVGRFIKRRIAMVLHSVFNILGIIAGTYISYKNGLKFMSIIYIIASGILWFYSTNYKKQIIVGNLIVALLTAMIPMLVILYEIPLLNQSYGEILLKHNTNLNFIFIWIAGFSFFAFLTTLIREIIKDAEDLEGDQAFGRVSIPMIIGFKWTKILVLLLISALISSILIILFKYIFDIRTFIYLLTTVIIPTLYLALLLLQAKEKKDYTRASIVMKIVMIGGVCYALLVKYLISLSF